MYPEYQRPFLKELFIGETVTMFVLAGMLVSPDRVGLWLPAASAAVYTISRLLDMRTTDMGLSTGLFYETSRELGPLPSRREHYSANRLVKDAIGVALATLIPPLGIGVGARNLWAAWKNLTTLRTGLKMFAEVMNSQRENQK